MGQTIQDSPWEVSVESVIGYEFVRDMQIKKQRFFRRQEKLFQSLVGLNRREKLHLLTKDRRGQERRQRNLENWQSTSHLPRSRNLRSRIIT